MLSIFESSDMERCVACGAESATLLCAACAAKRREEAQARRKAGAGAFSRARQSAPARAAGMPEVAEPAAAAGDVAATGAVATGPANDGDGDIAVDDASATQVFPVASPAPPAATAGAGTTDDAPTAGGTDELRGDGDETVVFRPMPSVVAGGAALAAGAAASGSEPQSADAQDAGGVPATAAGDATTVFDAGTGAAAAAVEADPVQETAGEDGWDWAEEEPRAAQDEPLTDGEASAAAVPAAVAARRSRRDGRPHPALLITGGIGLLLLVVSATEWAMTAQQLDSLRTQVQAEQMTVQDMTQRLTKAEQDTAAAQAALATTKSSLAARTAEVAQLKDDKAALEAAVKTSDQEIATLRSNLASAQAAAAQAVANAEAAAKSAAKSQADAQKALQDALNKAKAAAAKPAAKPAPAKKP